MPLFHDGDAIHKSLEGEIDSLVEKVTLASTDFVIVEDSAASYEKKKAQLGNLPTGVGMGDFGKNYQTAVSLPRSTTTSSIMQDKTTLTTGGLNGLFRVSWIAVVDAAIAKEIRVRLYNVTDAVLIGPLQIHRPSASAGERSHAGGFAEVTFAGVAKTFKIQFASTDGVATVGIQDARIELWRLA